MPCTKRTARYPRLGAPAPVSQHRQNVHRNRSPDDEELHQYSLHSLHIPSLGYFRMDKTSLMSRGKGLAKLMPTSGVTAGRSRFRRTGWIYEGVRVGGETVTIPTIAICLHMDRDSSSIERDVCPCPAAMEAQRFPGLHISMCIAHRRVQPVVKHVHEEASSLLAHNFREDWLQRESQGVGESAPARWRTD